MTERNGSGGEDRYSATDATERRDPEGTTGNEAMAGAIGAGSPEDIGQSTRAANKSAVHNHPCPVNHGWQETHP